MRGLLGALVAVPIALLAVAADVAAHDSTQVRELQREVAELRSLVERLLQERGQVGSPSAATEESARAPTPAVRAAEEETPEIDEAPAREESAEIPEEETEEARLSFPSLAIHGFGDVSYRARHKDPTAGGSNTDNEFTIGDLDLLLTSEIAPRVSFLNETLFEFEGADEVHVDVERVLVNYEHADWANLSIGRGHTGVSYWNKRFHHGAWLQTTVKRPIFFEFEDEGGVLPMHYVGVEGSGSVRLAPGALGYILSVGNGRAPQPNDVQAVRDANDPKQVSLMLTYEPTAYPGFGIGFNALYDKIPSDPGAPGRAGQMDEVIGGVHSYYTAHPYEAIVEWEYIYHRDDRTKRNFGHQVGYAQVGYSLGKVKPYYRFDWGGFEAGDPYYLTVEKAQDTTGHTVGLRYDWRSFAAIKAEYRRKNAETQDTDAATIQFSVAF
jgi:hypothetical protein